MTNGADDQWSRPVRVLCTDFRMYNVSSSRKMVLAMHPFALLPLALQILVGIYCPTIGTREAHD